METCSFERAMSARYVENYGQGIIKIKYLPDCGETFSIPWVLHDYSFEESIG